MAAKPKRKGYAGGGAVGRMVSNAPLPEMSRSLRHRVVDALVIAFVVVLAAGLLSLGRFLL